MTDEPRIFVDDSPSEPSRGPWLALAVIATVVAVSAFILADRQPADDRDLVELPAPDITTTTSATVAPTTTTTRPPVLDLTRLVPSFDRSLILVTIEDRSIRVGSWAGTGPPVYSEHSIGKPGWVGVDAGGDILGAISSNSNDESVLWLGDPEHLEPVRIEPGLISAVFHAHEPGHLAVATVGGDETVVTFHDVASSQTAIIEEIRVTGPRFLISWTDAGLLMWHQEAEAALSLITESGNETPIEDQFPLYSSGAPLFVPSPRGEPVLTIADGVFVEMPADTVAVSPNRVFAITDSTFEQRLVDLETGIELPLVDPVGFPHGWSNDSRWFVYMSAIESFQRGVVNRFVFVDTMTGSTVTAAILDEHVSTPHLMFVAP